MKIARRNSLILILLLLCSFAIQAQLKYIQDITDLPPHPRILMLQGEEQQIKANIAADPAWTKIHNDILAECEEIVKQPELERIQTGRRLLAVSREALRRIFFLSYAYRMEGGEKYLRKAEKEMLAVSSFSDWNPSHFLDVAEMTLAMSIGYDWLYSNLSTQSREIIKNAILRKGIDPSLSSDNNGFLNGSHNWNQVCNAGITYGALAVYEDMPELSKMLIDRAIETIHLPMHEYAPAGTYPEGYMYWSYGTSFNVLFLSAIEKAFKTDYGLQQLPGFLKSSEYITNMIGPTGESFNFSDCDKTIGLHPEMFWFASKTNDMSLLWFERGYMDKASIDDRILPAIMVWGSNIRTNDIKAPRKLMWTGQGKTPVALMRTSWTDPKAIYLGFKLGAASNGHGHMDVGSFVMEADGVRWAMDFGMQDYHSLESRGLNIWSGGEGGQRWDVFRYNNFVHNTLTIDGKMHNIRGHADIRSQSSSPDFMNAISDISKVFDGQLAECVRGIALVDKKYVIVRDELKTLDKETTIRWTMLTSAKARITGKNTIELTKDGKKLKVEVVEPAKVTMKTWSTASKNDYDEPNPGTILIGFEVKAPANTNQVMSVKLIPQSAKNTLSKIPVLKEWPVQQ